MKEPVCKRCGQCCMIKFRGNPKRTIACRYLIIHDNGLTSCSVWNRREKLMKKGEFIKIGFNQKCVSRFISRYDFKDCPYNTNKKIISVEVKKR